MLVLEDAAAEIAELWMRFIDAVDDRDFARVGACFTRDAHARFGRSELVGREAIVPFLADSVGRRGTTKHLLGNPVVDLDGDVAILAVDVNLLDVRRDRLLVLVGRARDRIVRTPSGWQVADHEFDMSRTDVHVAG